jgi:hypothetical protein
MNRKSVRRMRRRTSAMHSDTPLLETRDIGLLRWVAACLRGLARDIEAVARRKRS